MSLNIVSLHHLKPEHIAMLQAVRSDIQLHSVKPAEAGPYLAEADILLAFGHTDLTPILPQAPQLKWIHALSAGVDKFLALDVFRNSDIILTNSRGIHGIPIAEHVLGMMLCSSRCLLTAYDNQKAHTWQALRGIDELYGKTAAVIGLGSVGHEIARHLKSMGMKILAVKQTPTSEPFVDQLLPFSQMAAAVSAADYVVVSLPLTQDTRGLFDLSMFQRMKPNACFINIARGPIVKEEDLIQALNKKIIRCAALDVFSHEPLPADSPLWDTPNLLITPHHASSSPQYIGRTLKIFTENLLQFPDCSHMRNLVDKKRGY